MEIGTNIRNNLEKVCERMRRAASRAGRSADDIQLVVVSKGQSIETIQAAITAGVRIFGENYPEESLPKIIETAGQNISWHMIGHLQSRKAKIVTNNFNMMHSLDSLGLAEKMARQLAELGRDFPVLLEFNVGGEESKSGWLAGDKTEWARLADEVGALLQLPHLQVRGLMTMPPLTTTPDQARKYFQKLGLLQQYLRSQFPDTCWDDLSMGTSSDFEAAIEEGATFIRIGSAILGARPGKA